MNNMLVFLRTIANKNLFRDVIVDSIDLRISDEAYLCSGFFQENLRQSTYTASSEKNLSNKARDSGIKLTTIGIYNNFWKPSYINFVRSMKNNCVKIDAYVIRGFRWHAKVFILRKNNKNILGIIGSSNITKPAFSTNSPFNYECDMIIWDKSVKKLNNLLLEDIKNSDKQAIIKTTYSEKYNEGISVHNRLEHIRKIIMDENKLVKLEIGE